MTHAQDQDHAHVPHVGLTVALAVLGVFVTYVPITGVSVSLHAISQATGASTTDLQWISDSYIIPMAAAVLSAGVFGDLHGRRRVYSLGMGLTIVGAAIAGLSATAGDAAVHTLWAGQAVSGLGAGLLLPTTLALIAHAVPDPHARGRFIGMWATGIVGGLAVGPLVSGVILEHAGWGWIFVPAGVLAVVAGVIAHLLLPESKNPAGRHLDWPGQATATLTIVASIFGVIKGGEAGWGAPATLVSLGIGALGLVAFVVVERRSSAPLMDLGLFRLPAFTAAGISVLAAMFSIVGTMFLLSVFLGSVQFLTPLQIGWRLLFVCGVAAVANPFVGRLMARVKPITLLTTGLVVAVVGTFLLLFVDESTGFANLAWRLAVFGLAFALVLTSVSVVAINAAPWQQAGMASATNTALRQYGGALGPAVLGTIYVARVQSGASPAAAVHAALLVTGILLAAAAVVTAAASLRGAGRASRA